MVPFRPMFALPVLTAILAVAACSCTGMGQEMAGYLQVSGEQPLRLRADNGSEAQLVSGGYYLRFSHGLLGDSVLMPRVTLESPQGDVTLSVPRAALDQDRALIPAAQAGQPYDFEVSTEAVSETDPAPVTESVSCAKLDICDDHGDGQYQTRLDCPGHRWQDVQYVGPSVRFKARVLDGARELAVLTGASHDGAERRVLREGPCN
jgi:hypothetical protein